MSRGRGDYIYIVMCVWTSGRLDAACTYIRMYVCVDVWMCGCRRQCEVGMGIRNTVHTLTYIPTCGMQVDVRVQGWWVAVVGCVGWLARYGGLVRLR